MPLAAVSGTVNVTAQLSAKFPFLGTCVLSTAGFQRCSVNSATVSHGVRQPSLACPGNRFSTCPATSSGRPRLLLWPVFLVRRRWVRPVELDGRVRRQQPWGRVCDAEAGSRSPRPVLDSDSCAGALTGRQKPPVLTAAPTPRLRFPRTSGSSRAKMREKASRAR
jgi:hypothetical protein